jgi:antitoxin (DNA-binding transcriptional repressor) of toxin-antitoxin stability system
MKTLSIREMRGALGQLDQLVEQEGELIATRRGQAIARALPLQPQRVMPSHAEHRSRLPRLSPSAEPVRDDRDARLP